MSTTSKLPTYRKRKPSCERLNSSSSPVCLYHKNDSFSAVVSPFFFFSQLWPLNKIFRKNLPLCVLIPHALSFRCSMIDEAVVSILLALFITWKNSAASVSIPPAHPMSVPQATSNSPLFLFFLTVVVSQKLS